MRLAGVRVAVTRARQQAEDLVRALALAGAEPLIVPLIRIEPPGDVTGLRAAATRAETWDWVVFTSQNAVHAFLEALARAGRPTSALRAVAAVGPVTAAALEARGVRVAFVPERFDAEALAEGLAAAGAMRGRRVLWPCGAMAGASFATNLRSEGATVEAVEAYRTVPDSAGAQELKRRIDARAIDVVTFASPSAVRSFVAGCGPDAGAARVAVIGPVTASTAESLGMAVHIRTSTQTAEGLVEAIAADAAQGA